MHHRKIQIWLFGILTSVCLIDCALLANDKSHKPAPISMGQAYHILKPAIATQNERANPEGIRGRVLCGYQGWFRADGDGSGQGFHHYQRKGRFEPGYCTIDLWPDLSEFDVDEKYPTAFKHQDGTTAHVFSSIHPKTVNRHFQWMADYSIDGVFVQRFAHIAAKPKNNYRLMASDNQKLLLCRDAAIKNQRCWALMYDLSGMRDEDFEHLARDWKNLRTKMQLGTDPNDSSYLHYQGKPLVAIWGVGFSDDRNYSLEKCEWLIRLFKHNPEWGGMSIMLGVPYHWREQNRDATDHPRLHQVLQLADIISPWSVGRYRNESQVRLQTRQMLVDDSQWCRKKNIDYLPVLFPGFSWRNLYPDDTSRPIERNGGKFYWEQFKAVNSAGIENAYVAMFDEIDEATAIFKCTNQPPVGASKFQTYDSYPSDHYLWLTQQGKRLLRNQIPSRNQK